MCEAPCHGPGHRRTSGCKAVGGVRGFLQPRLVMLLLEKPAHGYELLERLPQHGEMPGADTGLLYRTLRKLESEGLLTSTWDTEGQGPARRLYEVTPDGVKFLHGWAERATHIRGCLGQFLADYEDHFGKGDQQ